MSERRGARVVRGFTGGGAALLLALALGGDVSAQTAPDRGEPEPSVDITRIDWMTGCWRASDGGEELWTDGRGGQMLGLNRTWRDGRAVRWEFLRIYEARSTLIYAAAPSHQPPAEFIATVATEHEVVFGFPEHDFPTQIAYRRLSDDSIAVSVTGPGDDGTDQGFDIRFGRVSCDDQAS